MMHEESTEQNRMRQHVDASREKAQRESQKPSAIIIFVLAYVVFSASRLLIKVDDNWHDSLRRPEWVLPSLAEKIVWFAMFGFLALSSVFVFRAASGTKCGHEVLGLRLAHLVFLHGFFLLLYLRHDLLLAAIDSLLLAVAAIATAIVAFRKTDKGAAFLGVYGLWAVYNVAATWALYAMNRG